MQARSRSRRASASTAASSPSWVSGWSAVLSRVLTADTLAGDRATLAKTPGRQRIERSGVDAAEPGPGVLAERRPVVAPLLEDDQTPAQGRCPTPDLVVD